MMTEERLEQLRTWACVNSQADELVAEIDRLRAVEKSARETMKLYGSIEFYNERADYRAEAHQWLAENPEAK